MRACATYTALQSHDGSVRHAAVTATLPPRPSRMVDWEAYTYTTLYPHVTVPHKADDTAAMEQAERVQRAGLVQRYVGDLLALLRAYNAQWRALTQRCLTALQHDEAEERRFLDEDAHLLPYALFCAYTQAAIARCVACDEACARAALWREQVRGAVALLAHREAVARMQLCTEALDSVFLKQCQTLPSSVWRNSSNNSRSGDDDDKAAEQQSQRAQSQRSTFVQTMLACRDVARAEAAARAQLVSEHVQWYAVTALLLARVQKTQLLCAHALPDTVTAHRLLHGSATTLQAAYRGYALRRRHRRAQAIA